LSVPCCTSTVAVAARAARIGAKLEHLGLQQQHFEQLLDADALGRRNFADNRVAAVFLRHEPLLLQLALHAQEVRARQIDFVDCDHDLHLGGARMVDRLERGRHDAVIRRDDENDDVGHVRAARAHGGERLVARRVEESDEMLAALHGVGTHVLRDAARLARGDARLADRIEQRGLAMVDVAHERDDRRTRLEFRRLGRLGLRRLDDLDRRMHLARALFALLDLEGEAELH
jgi:hypothetical protein